MDINTNNNEKIKIAVLTSGGDAPGMNAAIRATVRAGLYYGYDMWGVYNGYAGLLNEELKQMTAISVSDIMARGGTVLKTSRSPEFTTEEGRQKALAVLKKFGISHLVVIGGDGSFHGAYDLMKSSGGTIHVMGIPGTIDNDIGCTDETIGYDTALNSVKECMDKIKDTTLSHERCSLVEVMGRHAGYIALNCAISGDAEAVILPEKEFDLQKDVVEPILEWRTKGKKHFLLVVAEGACDTMEVAQYIKQQLGIKPTVSVLGYLQRGGSPTVRDRVLASMMGVHSIELLREGKTDMVLATKGSRVVSYPFEDAMSMTKTLDEMTVNTMHILGN